MAPDLSPADRADRRLVAWAARNGVLALRLSIGLAYIWFGVLKFIPGVSPIESLANRTFEKLSFGLISQAAAGPILATWEVAIGIGLVSGLWTRAVVVLLLVQLLGAMSPLLLFPHDTWKFAPFVLTLEGQYIVKDIIIIAAAMVVGATVRGGGLVAGPRDPQPPERAATTLGRP